MDNHNSPVKLIMGSATLVVAAPVIIAGLGIFKAIWPVVPILLAASVASGGNTNANNNNKGKTREEAR